MTSTIKAVSNVMIDDERHRSQEQYLPGDFFAQIYPGRINLEYCHLWMTQKQIREYKQYLVCGLCHRTCAATCGLHAIGR
jgi:hypothetical protein